MPVTTDVIITYRECPEEAAEAVSLAALREVRNRMNGLLGYVEQADLNREPLTPAANWRAAALYADLDALARDVDRHHQGIVCGWSGDVQMVRDVQAEYRWTCPRCGTEHEETVERGADL